MPVHLGSIITVQLLHVDDCPSWRRCADLLDELAAQLGFTWSAILVDTPEAAQALGFHGSPTVHINGSDPFADAQSPVGLTCRIYRTSSGASTVPDPALLRSALIAATPMIEG